MTLIRLLALYLALTGAALAADLNPPAWRGEQGTTFQQWDFMFETGPYARTTISECSQVDFIETEQGRQALPDIIKNPYEKSTGICVEFKSLWFITRRLDWLQTWYGKDGIWKLQSHRSFENFLNFIIPNAANNTDTSTIIYLQMIYRSLRGEPVVTVQYPVENQPLDSKAEPYLEPAKTSLPEDWVHAVYMFRAAGCPRYESVFIYPPREGDIYLDSIAIDTACTEGTAAIPGE